MLTGMLAAELRVKKAVTPLSFRQVSTRIGLRLIFQKTMSGLTTKAMNSMQPISTTSSWA